MKTRLPLILPLMALGLAACDQKQSQILGLREEFQRQAQAKDKTIDDLNRKIVDLSEKNGQLQQQLLKISQESVSPEKFAEAVAQRMEQQNSEVKKGLEEIKQTLSSGGGGNSVARRPEPRTDGPVDQPKTSVSDPSRKKYKFDF